MVMVVLADSLGVAVLLLERVRPAGPHGLVMVPGVVLLLLLEVSSASPSAGLHVGGRRSATATARA